MKKSTKDRSKTYHQKLIEIIKKNAEKSNLKLPANS